MFRILLISGFFIASLVSSYGQLMVGPVAGMEVSKVFFFEKQPRYKTLPCLGFEGGLMATMRVRKNFVLGAQLLYSQRNKHIVGQNDSRSDSKFDLKAHMRYIELPIFYLLEFKKNSGNLTGQGGETKVYNWFVGAGPTISYWMSNKGSLRSSYLLENFIDHINYTTVWGRDNASFDQKKDIDKENFEKANRFQFGINITGGVAFQPNGTNKIVTSFHLNIAQTFFAKSDGYFPASFVDVDIGKAKNHSIRFTVAYLFDTKIEKNKRGKSTSKLSNKKRK